VLIFKTLKSILKNILTRSPLHVSAHIYDHLQGAREQYFMRPTAHEPPEDGRKYGPKHVGATLLKCF